MKNLIGAVVVGVSLLAGVAAAEVSVHVSVPVPVVRVVAPEPRVVVYQPVVRETVIYVQPAHRKQQKGNNGKHRR